MTAEDIVKLLAVKHSGDVFVPQCKNGPTQYTHGLAIADAWVMPRSWSKPSIIAYEVKVDRGDFLRDEKWPAYLDMCNQFSFVAPKGIIEPEEVPEQAGLLLLHGTQRLITKKKAPAREIECPEDVFRYVLMARSSIGADRFEREVDRATYWRQWLRTKDEKKELGYNVSRKMAQLVTERIDKVQMENDQFRAEQKRLAWVEEVLASVGIESTWDYHLRTGDRDGTLKLLFEVDPKFEDHLKSAAEAIGRVRCSWEHLRSRIEPSPEEPT